MCSFNFKCDEKENKISPLEAHLGFWMRAVSNQVSQGFKRKVEARGVDRGRVGGAA